MGFHVGEFVDVGVWEFFLCGSAHVLLWGSVCGFPCGSVVLRS